MMVVVGVMVIAILAAVAMPTLGESVRFNDAQRTAEMLNSLSLSLYNSNSALGNPGFAQWAGQYPSALNQLEFQITTAQTSCLGARYKSTAASKWATSGQPPYSPLSVVPQVGVTTPLGVIRDTIIKTTSPSNTWVELHIDSLSTVDANNLDIAVDGAADSTTESSTNLLRYTTEPGTATSAKLHQARYLIPIHGMC